MLIVGPSYTVWSHCRQVQVHGYSDRSQTAYRPLMGTLVAGVIGFSLLAVLFAAAFLLIHRRRASRMSLEEPADRYRCEIREIQRITHARSEHRYTRQVGDPPGGNYGTGSGA